MGLDKEFILLSRSTVVIVVTLTALLENPHDQIDFEERVEGSAIVTDGT